MSDKTSTRGKLPDNLSYINFTNRNTRALLKCKCGYSDESWGIIPKNASDKTKCPKCRNEDLLAKIKERLAGKFEIINGSSPWEYAQLKCLVCGYIDPKWKIKPGNITEKTECPHCVNKNGITSFYQKLIPDNIIVTNYNGINNSSDYKCRLCDYEGNIKFKNLKNIVKCRNCKNRGDTLLIKNKELRELTGGLFEIIIYEGTNKPSLIKCDKCCNVWSKTLYSINKDLKCPKCKSEYISSEYFDEFLMYNEIKIDLKPRNKKEKFTYICIQCNGDHEGSINSIENGLVCEFCENSKPRNNLRRCYNFQKRNSKFVKLKWKLTNKVNTIKHQKYNPITDKHDIDDDIDIIVDDYLEYIWTCNEGHEICLTLSEIKKRFQKHGVINWCYDCSLRTSYLTMSKIASDMGWMLVIENIKDDDFYLSSSIEYIWTCKNGHSIKETYVAFKKRRKCDLCPSTSEGKVKEAILKGIDNFFLEKRETTVDEFDKKYEADLKLEKEYIKKWEQEDNVKKTTKKTTKKIKIKEGYFEDRM